MNGGIHGITRYMNEIQNLNNAGVTSIQLVSKNGPSLIRINQTSRFPLTTKLNKIHEFTLILKAIDGILLHTYTAFTHT